MISLKKGFLVCTAYAISALAASATFWTGTITETLTQSPDPNYPVGMQEQGSYLYESDSVDGTFGGRLYSDINPESIPTLSGVLFGFLGLPYSQGSTGFDTSYILGNQHLVVQDGHVTDFGVDGEDGSDYRFYYQTFTVMEWGYHGSPSYRVYGTLSFSDPLPVPESGSTLYSTAMGLACLAFIRRRIKARCS